jgi:hypothetical protein
VNAGRIVFVRFLEFNKFPTTTVPVATGTGTIPVGSGLRTEVYSVVGGMTNTRRARQVRQRLLHNGRPPA